MCSAVCMKGKWKGTDMITLASVHEAATAAIVFFVGSIGSCMIFMPMLVLGSRGAEIQLLVYAGIGVGAQIPTAFLLFRIHRSLGRGVRAGSPAPTVAKSEGGSPSIRDTP